MPSFWFQTSSLGLFSEISLGGLIISEVCDQFQLFNRLIKIRLYNECQRSKMTMVIRYHIELSLAWSSLSSSDALVLRLKSWQKQKTCVLKSEKARQKELSYVESKSMKMNSGLLYLSLSTAGVESPLWELEVRKERDGSDASDVLGFSVLNVPLVEILLEELQRPQWTPC